MAVRYTYAHLLLWLRAATLALAFSPQARCFRVVSVIPDANNREAKELGESLDAETSLEGFEAITATFNRAFIALGSDFTAGSLPDALNPFVLTPLVRGRWRWVTTSVIRFDPTVEWPAELHLTLLLKDNVTDFSGTTLSSNAQRKWRFSTPSLSMGVQSVQSARAKELTGGRWDSGIGIEGGPEVPPDARILLSFSDDVDRDIVGDALVLRPVLPTKGASVPFTLHACNVNDDDAQSIPYDNRCVRLMPGRTLEVDGFYELVLPAGSGFHKNGGTVARSLTVALRGLYGFSFQFQIFGEYRPAYHRQHLWLRHGLMEHVNLDDLAACFQLKPSLPINLTRLEKGVLQLSAPFQPGETYTLSVEASETILDGFGLPLRSSSTQFQMATLQDFLMEPASAAFGQPLLFVSGESSNSTDLSWPILFRGRSLCLPPRHEGQCPRSSAQFVSFAKVDASNLKEAIATLMSSSQTYIPVSTEKRLQAVYAPLNDDITYFDIKVKPSELLLKMTWNQVYPDGFGANGPKKNTQLLSTPSFVAHLVASPSNLLVAWIVNIATNAPIAKANVKAHCVANRYPTEPRPDDVIELASATTNSLGLAEMRFSFKDCLGQRWLTVVADGEVPLVQNNPPVSYASLPSGRRSRLLTDRAVYKPGDEVMVKGYVREQVGARMKLVEAVGIYALNVRWGDRPDQAQVVTVALDKTFGSFEAKLKIPDDARFRDTTITLEMMTTLDPQSNFLASATVTIADPRPPTVSLSVVAMSKFISPGGKVTLEVGCSTLSGVPLSGSDVRMQWELQRKQTVSFTKWSGRSVKGSPAGVALSARGDNSRKEAPKACKTDEKGEEHIYTGTDGKAVIEWRPAEMPSNECLGDRFVLRFEWVGPTRELLTKELRVPVSLSSLTLDVILPANLIVPTIPFTVGINLHEHADLGGQSKSGVPLNVSLRKTDTTPVVVKDVDFADAHLHSGVVVSTCSGIVSELSEVNSCELTLPGVGYYIVSVCASIQSSLELCTTTSVGRTEEEWHHQPLTRYLAEVVKVTQSEQSYRIGETPVLTFFNPRSGLRAFLLWGSHERQRYRVTDPLEAGNVALNMGPIGEECTGGCSLLLMLSAAGSEFNTVPVPASPLFDAKLPESATVSLNIVVEEESSYELRVDINVEDEVALPGSLQNFTISLRNADGSPAKGEVCIFVVDQAMLDVKPHPLVNLSSAFAPANSAPNFAFEEGYSQISSAQTLKYTTDWMRKVVALDPWLLPGANWLLKANPYVDVSSPSVTPEDFMQRHFSELTAMASNYNGHSFLMDAGIVGPMMSQMSYDASDMEMASRPKMAMMAMAMDVAASPPNQATTFVSGESRSNLRGVTALATPSGGMAGSGASRIRSSFISTPLFRTFEVDGERTETWKLPDNTGRFELRAYAVSEQPDVFGGGSTTQQIVRRDATLTPSVPRVARVGDRFQCGVTVTVADLHGKPLELTVALATTPDPLVFLEVGSGENVSFEADGSQSTTQSVIFKPGESLTKEAVFPMSARVMGNQSMVLTLEDSAGLLDQLQLFLPVVGSQPEVYIATSRSIPAYPERGMPWEEGLTLPTATNGSGYLQIVAGVGHLPFVESVVDGFVHLADPRSDSPPNAIDYLCAIASSVVLAPYKTSRGERSAVKLAFDRGVSEIEDLTTSMGLHYSRFSLSGPVAYVDLQLNAFALFVVRRLRIIGKLFPDGLERLEKTWRNALSLGLVDSVKRSSDGSGRPHMDYEILTISRLALGPAWTFEGAPVDVQEALSMSALLANRNSLSVFSKAALATVFMLPDNPVEDDIITFKAKKLSIEVKQLVDELVTDLASSIRVTARSGYIARNPGSKHAADLRANSMALTAFAFFKRYTNDDYPTNIDKLTNYVARGGGESRGGGTAALFAAFGVVDYDESAANVNANVLFTTFAGDLQLLSAPVTSAAPEPVTFETMWSKLPSPTPPIMFDASGEGEVSVALTLRFVPATLFSQPVYRGIDVQKVIQSYDSKFDSPSGPPVSTVPLGRTMIVTVQISTPDDLYGVLLEDWLPAGLEAIDPNLVGGVGYEGFPSCGWLPFRSCTHFSRETKKDRVIFYAPFVFAGTHSLQYQVIVVTRGIFVIPPAHAFVTLEPEVMGLSAGGELQVTASDTSEIASKPQTAPKDCPGDCMGQGTCDSATGFCVCYAGMVGADCSEIASVPNLTISNLTLIAGAIRIISGGAIDLVLDVKLLSWEFLRGGAKELLVKWLFARVASLTFPLTQRRLGSPADLHSLLQLDVNTVEQQVTIKAPQKLSEAVKATVSLTGSSDGSLFGSRLLEVWVYPDCIPQVTLGCDLQGKLGGPQGHLDGQLDDGVDLQRIETHPVYSLPSIGAVSVCGCLFCALFAFKIHRRKRVLGFGRQQLLTEMPSEGCDVEHIELIDSVRGHDE